MRIQDEPYLVVRREPDANAGTEVRGHEPYFAARSSDAAQVVVNARTMQMHDRDFSEDELLDRVRGALPGTECPVQEMLATYDSYYYSRDGLAPLPVLRVKLADPRDVAVHRSAYEPAGGPRSSARSRGAMALQRFSQPGFLVLVLPPPAVGRRA